MEQNEILTPEVETEVVNEQATEEKNSIEQARENEIRLQNLKTKQVEQTRKNEIKFYWYKNLWQELL